jgi:hypothetical protein
MASPTIAGTPATTAISTAATSGAMNLPSGITAGELLIAVIMTPLTTNVFTVPSGWSSMTTVTSTPSCVFARYADGTESGTTTFSWSGTQKATAIIFRVAGHGYIGSDVTSWTDATNSPSNAAASGSSTAPNPAVSDTTVLQDNLYIAIASWLQDQTANTYPTGYGLSQTTVSSGGAGGGATKCGSAIAGKQATSTSDDPGAFGITTTTNWQAFTLALKPPRTLVVESRPHRNILLRR